MCIQCLHTVIVLAICNLLDLHESLYTKLLCSMLPSIATWASVCFICVALCQAQECVYVHVCVCVCKCKCVCVGVYYICKNLTPTHTHLHLHTHTHTFTHWSCIY